MISSVIAYRFADVGSAPFHFDKSISSPAVTVTLVRHRGCSFRMRGSKIAWAPHDATGMTGAPVSRNSRAMPVLPRCGHNSPTLGVVPSG